MWSVKPSWLLGRDDELNVELDADLASEMIQHFLADIAEVLHGPGVVQAHGAAEDPDSGRLLNRSGRTITRPNRIAR